MGSSWLCAFVRSEKEEIEFSLHRTTWSLRDQKDEQQCRNIIESRPYFCHNNLMYAGGVGWLITKDQKRKVSKNKEIKK